jgi:hypothetical protein
VWSVPICGPSWQNRLSFSDFRRSKSCCYFGDLAYAFAASNGRSRSEIGGMSVSLVALVAVRNPMSGNSH